MSTSLSPSSSLDMLSLNSLSTRWASDSLSDDEDQIVWSLSSSTLLSPPTSSPLSETADYVLVPRIVDAPPTPTPAPAPGSATATATTGSRATSGVAVAGAGSSESERRQQRDTRTSSDAIAIADGMAALSLSLAANGANKDKGKDPRSRGSAESRPACPTITKKKEKKEKSKKSQNGRAGSSPHSPSASSSFSSVSSSSSSSSPSSSSSARPGGPGKARSESGSKSQSKSKSKSAEVTTSKKKRSKKSSSASGSSSSVHTTPAPAPAPADVPSTNAKEGGENKEPSSSTISTGYHEAHKFMSSYLAHPPPPGNNGSALLMLQALILELGCLPSAAAAGKFSIPELPGTMRQAKLLLKSHAFINVRDYLAVREQGQAALRGVMHPSRKSLVREVRKGKRVPVKEVKKAGLNILLVNTRL